MPTCFSIVQKYGHLQKFSLQTVDVFLVVASPPRVFLGGGKWKQEPEKPDALAG